MNVIAVRKIQLAALLFILCVIMGHGQDVGTSGPDYIETLISENKITEAKTQLAKDIEAFITQKNYDTLIAYIPLMGSPSLSDGDSQKAIEKAATLAQKVIGSSNNTVAAKAILQISNLYYTSRQIDMALKTSMEALEYATRSRTDDSVLLSRIHYNIGTNYLNLGNAGEAKKYLLESKRLIMSIPGRNLQEKHNIFNSMGRYYANITQLDSSTYYYKNALFTLDKMDSTEVNRDYWKALVNNNISLNLQNTGNTQEAMEYVKKAILNYQKFIAVSKDESKKIRARQFRLSTIDNLGTFYHGLGEYNRAVEILTYSYREKLKLFDDDDPNVVFSLAILSHGHLSAKNYEQAGLYADMALTVIEQNPANYTLLHSYTLGLRASIYEATMDWDNARSMYQKSEALYMRDFDGNYSKDYLENLKTMSLFYTKTGDAEKGLQLATTGYEFTKRKAFQNDLIHFHHIQNMADVHFGLKNFDRSLKYSKEALSFFDSKDFTSRSLADSIQIEFIKPRTLLVNAQSHYQLQPNKTESFLKDLLLQIETGLSILERRKTLIKTPEDLEILMDDNNELFNFAKQLRLDLFHLTNKEQYLDDLIRIHESSIYNRIRARLNIRNNLAFSKIPADIIQREHTLKKAMSVALSPTENASFNTFFEASSAWEVFLDSLKSDYPKYYKMRYATIEEELGNLQQNIPNNATVVRYFFIEENLYAFVVSSSEKNLYALDFHTVKDYIPQLIHNDFNVNKISTKLHELYQQLWDPFAKTITTKKIIIIPDRELFNLSFELLTPTPIHAFSDLATNSLLSKHSISYNFSLLTQNQYNTKINVYSKNFVAFAPEFSEKMKNDYKIAVTDSVSLDQNYLTLLPQPFSIDVAKNYSRIFDGSLFLNEKASKHFFTKNAKEHKVIHIGTHAESNNVSPELSRLIFAKNLSEENPNDNFLYTYEIYNQDLSSQLAILTACETGKPTYQAGEGMISLAHAFTYAGSESILTSLWKIDEKSSAEIVSYFYDNLAKGMPKDEALQQAKLHYLASAKGREIAPQYWAGLVLMGDTLPLELETGMPWWYWAIAIFILCVILFLFLIRRKTSSLSSR
ncbi:CHAT domain-containing protein [Altibacter lentus]|uniref:CHAT domain-containing protein n=1 Tax=Altibacter lentus TaxID=1223410 RepID=UPI0005578214|nr:CHAT domain-containing tetratricopeptide repeat protein [Altibacter lentus]